MNLCILGLCTVTLCELVGGCQRIGGTCCPFFSVEVPPLLTEILIFSALQRCFPNIISLLSFSTEILCSFPLNCCMLLKKLYVRVTVHL